MSILWKPNGTLNVATAATDLQETKGSALTGDDGSIVSEALSRCKNLRVDRKGIIQTRKGSAKLHSTAINSVNKIIEQAGTRYAFGGGSIYSNETSIESGLTNADWQGILYNAYNDTTQDIFALNGTDRIRIEGGAVYEWGIDAPTTAPTITTGASTGLTGKYNAKYTYCRKVSSVVVCESDPSPAGAAAVDLNDGSLSVTWTASSDAQVTHVRVYRTLLDGDTYYHDQDIAIGTVTVDTDTADGDLGSEVATDHDRPPLGSYVLGPNYNGTCFIAKDNLLYYCLPKQPEYWPATYYIEAAPPQFPIQCVVFYDGAPYCLTKHHIIHIQGTGHESFFPFDMRSVTGCVNPNAAVAMTGYGIAHVGTDGIYLYNSGLDKNITQLTFAPLFSGEDTNGIPGISSFTTCWLAGWRNQLYFGWTSTGHYYPTNVLVFNLDTLRSTYYSYTQGIRTICADYTNNRLLAGDSDGYVWVLEYGTDDAGTAISWEAQSKDYQLQTRAHFPRYVKYDVDASDDDCSANGYLILDGTVHQTHALTENRNVKKRLVTTGNGKKMAIRVSGSGPVSIYAVEAE